MTKQHLVLFAHSDYSIPCSVFFRLVNKHLRSVTLVSSVGIFVIAHLIGCYKKALDVFITDGMDCALAYVMNKCANIRICEFNRILKERNLPVVRFTAFNHKNSRIEVYDSTHYSNMSVASALARSVAKWDTPLKTKNGDCSDAAYMLRRIPTEICNIKTNIISCIFQGCESVPNFSISRSFAESYYESENITVLLSGNKRWREWVKIARNNAKLFLNAICRV